LHRWLKEFSVKQVEHSSFWSNHSFMNMRFQHTPTLTPTHPNMPNMLSERLNSNSHTQMTIQKQPKPKKKTFPQP